MTDMGDDFRAMRQHRKQRKERDRARNTARIEASGLDYCELNNGSCLRIELADGHAIDFWPSTNKYQLCGGEEIRHGHAGFVIEFIDGYHVAVRRHRQ